MNSWFYVAQIFVKIGKLKEAEKCIDEIKNLGRGYVAGLLLLYNYIFILETSQKFYLFEAL